jgi:benzoate-CoA ligase
VEKPPQIPVSPPAIRSVPAKFYNAAADLTERNLIAGRGNKVAVIDETGTYTYNELAECIHRCANAFREFGLAPGQRVVLCLLDTIDFPVSFLGAIMAGIVPIPVNTLWTASDYAFLLADSGAQAAVVSEDRLAVFLEAVELADWKGRVLVSGAGYRGALPGFSQLLDSASPRPEVHATKPDDVCFWLYSSGSTGRPKAAVHLQTSLMQTAELFAQNILGLNEHDIVYSAAKLFFAYGLGNSLSFPMSVGATSILYSGRPTPAAVNAILREKRPAIF